MPLSVADRCSLYKLRHPEKVKEQRRIYREKTPWLRTYRNIKNRCEKINCASYKWYGKRGIECRITIQQLKKLWFDDRAYFMDWPSIDRINPNGHYTVKNCRFVELSLNVKHRVRQ